MKRKNLPLKEDDDLKKIFESSEGCLAQVQHKSKIELMPNPECEISFRIIYTLSQIKLNFNANTKFFTSIFPEKEQKRLK